MIKLDSGQIQQKLASLHGWSVDEQLEITKTFKLADFPRALLFINAVGLLAEAVQHHPDILVQYNRVTISLTTHDAAGLTEKDFDLADQIEALPLP